MSGPSDDYSPHRSSNNPTNLPSINAGYMIIVSSVLFFLIIGYATFFSAFISPPPNLVLKLVVEDTHYKYLVLFLIPTSSYFAIANWVGWQYYQNS